MTNIVMIALMLAVIFCSVQQSRRLRAKMKRLEEERNQIKKELEMLQQATQQQIKTLQESQQMNLVEIDNALARFGAYYD